MVLNNSDSLGFLPTIEQELLLRVALADPEAAGQAWTTWRTVRGERGLSGLDEGSQRLMPLVARRLEPLRVDEPERRKIRGIHRKSLARNLLLYHRARPTLRRLVDAGVPVLLLKGIVLSRLVYPDPGARCMGDLDVLVPPDDFERALDVLAEEGAWRPALRHPRRRPEVLNSQAYRQQEALELDVHSHVLVEGVGVPAADTPLWERSQSETFDGVPVRVLSSTDLLLHACVHGACWSPGPIVTWAADAGLLLERRGAEVDWDLLLAEALRLRVGLALSATLGYLPRIGVAVPAAVLRALEDLPADGLARRYFASRSQPFTRWNSLSRLWHDYRFRLAPERALPEAALGFPRYLRLRWDLESFWELVPTVLERARRFPGRNA